MSRNDGGQAFARARSVEEGYNGKVVFDAQRGMSLRDYFAAKAMAAVFQHEWTNERTYSDTARRAYEMADALLAERDKAGEEPTR